MILIRFEHKLLFLFAGYVVFAMVSIERCQKQNNKMNFACKANGGNKMLNIDTLDPIYAAWPNNYTLQCWFTVHIFIMQLQLSAQKLKKLKYLAKRCEYTVAPIDQGC